jgi:hypothetical protein
MKSGVPVSLLYPPAKAIALKNTLKTAFKCVNAKHPNHPDIPHTSTY